MVLALAVAAGVLRPDAIAAATPDASADLREAGGITEVRISTSGDSGGRGWALTVRVADHESCEVVTPFHVVGDVLTREAKPGIVVAGAGELRGQPSTLLEQERDLALLRLDRLGPCPFVAGASTFQYLQGEWLARLNDVDVLEELRVDRGATVQPLGSDGQIARLRMTPGNRQMVAQGWSGATVFRDGVRIGMVSQASEDGSWVTFYAAAAIQRAFGEHLRLFCTRNDDGAPGCNAAPGQSAGQDTPVCPRLFGVQVRLVFDKNEQAAAERFGSALEQKGAHVDLDPRLRAQLAPATRLRLSETLADIAGDIQYCATGWIRITSRQVGRELIRSDALRGKAEEYLEIVVGSDDFIR